MDEGWGEDGEEEAERAEEEEVAHDAGGVDAVVRFG